MTLQDKPNFHTDFSALSKEDQDKVLNPSHYKLFEAGTYPLGIEYTDVCIALFKKNGLDSYTNHLIGQSVKYLTRVGQKDAASQDLGKAAWYLEEAKDYLLKEGRYVRNNFIALTEKEVKE